MEIIKLAWVGTRTERAEQTVAFFRDLLGLRLALQLEDFWVLKLPDGSKIEVFGPDSPVNRHFTTGPVAGFLVDDVFGATEELRSAGIEILLEPELDDSGNALGPFPRPRRHNLRIHPRPRSDSPGVAVARNARAARQHVRPENSRVTAMKRQMLKISLIAAAAVIVVLAGCASDTATSERPVEHGSASAAAGPGGSGFNETDIMFVQMMLPHSDQAVSMTDLLLDKRGVNPEVAALARQIRDAQQADIETMNGWFEAMGRPQVEEGPHHGGLEGMLDENEMQQLDLANARDGQRLFLEGMIKHHTGAIQLAKRETADGQHSAAIELATNIATTQQQEIDVMTDLLTKL